MTPPPQNRSGSPAGRHDPPRRVRVTSPRRNAPGRAPRRPAATELDEERSLGALYVYSLVRAQRRLSLYVLVGVTVVVGALPLLVTLVPGIHDIVVAGIPLPWLLLGVLIYPFAVVVARAYARAAERVDREFAEQIRRT